MADEQYYLQFLVQVSDELLRDQLVAQLSGMGIEGFEEQEAILVASGNEVEIAQEEVAHLLKSLNLTFEVKRVANQNWNAEWESSFEPVLVDNFVAIRAGFHAPVTQVRHELIITPKMSFGTGHHATTWLMVKAMENLAFAGKKVLDFGTGTGVLAILAAKLGASSVTAIDNDSWSIDNAKENLHVNNVTNVEISLADTIPTDTQFDIILANINKHVLMAHGASMAAATLDGGTWLLSGLLEQDEADIVQMASSAGMQHLVTEHRNGWISIHFRKLVSDC